MIFLPLLFLPSYAMSLKRQSLVKMSLFMLMMCRGHISPKVARIHSDSCKVILRESTDYPLFNLCVLYFLLRESNSDSPDFTGENLCESGFSDSCQNSPP